MKLKKYLGVLLSGIMVLSMAACAGTDKGQTAAPERGRTFSNAIKSAIMRRRDTLCRGRMKTV